jgi:hypothetical protein
MPRLELHVDADRLGMDAARRSARCGDARSIVRRLDAVDEAWSGALEAGFPTNMCGSYFPTHQPGIRASFPGAFTAPGANETVHLIDWRCMPKSTMRPEKTKGYAFAMVPAPQPFSRYELVVTSSSNEIVARTFVPEDMLPAVSDVDSDGLNEMVLVKTPTEANRRSEELKKRAFTARVVRFVVGELAIVYDFENVGLWCGRGEKEIRVPVLEYRNEKSTVWYRVTFVSSWCGS